MKHMSYTRMNLYYSMCCVITDPHTFYLSSVAYVAGVALANLSPAGITFGAPKVIKEGGCSALDSKKWYRFVNTIQSQFDWPIIPKPMGLRYDQWPLAYDKVPFLKFPSCGHYGLLLVLGYDASIASIGLDSQLDFFPPNKDAGRMTVKDSDRTNRGYLDRLVTIRKDYTSIATYPVPLKYADYDLCTKDVECASGNCARLTPIHPRRCLP